MFFEDHDAVYVPAKGARHALWTSPKSCVWEAPGFYDQFFPLACVEGYQGNRRLGHLFNGILDIENTDHLHYIKQLEVQKSRSENLLLLTDIYNQLARSNLDELDWMRMR